MAKEIEKDGAAPSPHGGPELRLVDRRAFIGFPRLELSPGIAVEDFALLVPDVTFPFNLSGGASRYQRKTLQFGFLELSVEAEVVARAVKELSSKLPEIDELKLFFRPGYLEGQGRLKGAEATPLTFKVAFDGDGERLAVHVYDVRLYGFSATPAARIGSLLSRGLQELDVLPGVELRGTSGFTTRLLPPLCQAAAVSRGYKLPSLDQARLSAAEISGRGLKLRFTTGGLPPPANPDEELLLALEGSRAFADAEALVAEGKLAEAREAYLKLGDIQDAHPFAAERLLSLLVADPQAHELALDVAAAVLRRRERSAAALWAEAVIRERRGEAARAAERYLALCALARKSQEESSAFLAAEAAARVAREAAPQMAVKALHELLGIRPDHLPSLEALARAADLAKDRAGAIRAYRRLAALARDPSAAAEAHVHLARLCAETEDDVAGARLHCEAALKLSPDHPEALLQLGELCHRAGEHLRGLKALDRLREVAMARHEIDRVGRASLLAGRVWEDGLSQLENALLRYREAASLLPGDPAPHHFLARAAEKLNKLQEATAGYEQCVELAGPSPKDAEIRRAAHASHHALSRIARTRLADPVRAREHLEAALALDPRDLVALEELIPFFRASGRPQELAGACEKAAAATDDPARRAAFWAEAGELYRGRLGDPEKADRLLNAALEADPKNRGALEGMLALAEARRDGGQLCRCLGALAGITSEPKERARLFRRLAVAARDLAFDLDLATSALTEVLRAEPEDLAALGELCALHRKRADMNGLVLALEQRARIAEAQGDRRLASAALREMAQVLELRLGRVGEALVALEKAARLAPDHGVLLELADLALRCERPEHARKALEELAAALPKHAAPERVAEVRARLGRTCELVGDRPGAMAHYAEAFPLRRLDDALATRLEALYQDAGKSRELGELWAARAQALMEAGRGEAAAPLYLRSARALVDLGERPAALLRLSAALDAGPSGPHAPEILELMAELELERGGKLEAAQLLARRAGFLPRGREAARLLHRAAGLCSGTPRELEHLTQAVDQDPAFPPSRVRRSELLAERDPAAALADLEIALAAPEADPEAPPPAERAGLFRRAATAGRLAKRADVARRHLAAYAAQRPDDVEALFELAELHRGAGAKDALCDLLASVWQRLSGDRQRQALREYAQLSLELSRTHGAVDALRAVLAREPEDAWAARALLGLLPELPVTRTEEAERLSLFAAVLPAAPREERSELLARRAALHHAANRLADAHADLLAAAELSGRPRELFRKAAEAARALGDERAEIAAWRAAAARDPELASDGRDRLLALSRGRLEARDFEAARDACRASLQLPLSPEERSQALFLLSRAALALGDEDTAADALRRASAEGPPARRLEAALALAELLEKRADLHGAVAAVEAALVASPRHPRAVERLGRLLRAVGDWAALAELWAAEAAHAPSARAVVLLEELAELYSGRLDSPGPAEAALRRAVQLDRSRAGAQARLAGLLFDRGDAEGAARCLEGAAAAVPPEPAAELLRGGAEACQELGAAEVALRLARRAARLQPPRDHDLLLLAGLLYRAGAAAEALPRFEELSRSFPFEDQPEAAEEILLALADLSLHAGDPDRAQRALRQLLLERPLCAAAVDRLAEVLSRQSPREALALLAEHASKLAPCEPAVRRLSWIAGRAQAELADLELAARCLSRAAEIAHHPLPLRRRLAELYRAAGRTHELASELERITELSLASDDPHAAIEALEEQARLAEEGGRVDAALGVLERARSMWEEQNARSSAAIVERRRAEILRDAKQDLEAAAAAFERAFSLAAEAQTAQLALALARRRQDPRAEELWLSRAAELPQSSQAKGRLLLELARCRDEKLGDAQGAEAAVRDALRIAPELPEAEELLTALFEREGRLGELAGFYEERAGQTRDPAARAVLFQRAAGIYLDRARDPQAAASALLAARAAQPDDLELTERAAVLLHQVGRSGEAAEFDAVLLEANPLQEAIFARHRAHLEAAGDHQSLAELLAHRSERLEGALAAAALLDAARSFRRAGAVERAQVCEDRAFDADPGSDAAFEAAQRRAGGDPRAMAQVLSARAGAMDRERAVKLLRERAGLLEAAGEQLLAAEAFDDLLAAAGEDVPALATRAELAFAAGGPQAAQPYDRRLLRAGGDALPAPVRLKAQLRLGHAALSHSALQDAADAFEAVVALDPEGERGREALSLLSEVHARTHNAEGLYRTSLALAAKAPPAESEALLRRAASLFEEPERVVDALVPLAKLHPADADLVDRAALALSRLSRGAELVELYERGAAAAGGERAAALLLRAAGVAGEALADPDRALALTERAVLVAPGNASAFRSLVERQRARGDQPGLLLALEGLASALEDSDERAGLELELARVAESLSDAARARRALEAVFARGPGRAGYREAVEKLATLLSGGEDPAALGRVLAARASLAIGKEKADFLLLAGRALERGGDLQGAAARVRDAVEAVPGLEGLVFLASLQKRLGEHAGAAAALAQAADLSAPEARGAFLVEAAEEREAAGEQAEAAELYERAAREAPALLPPEALAERLMNVGQADRALAAGFEPALAAGEVEKALSLAERGRHAPSIRRALWAQVDRASTAAPALAGAVARLRKDASSDEALRLGGAVEKRQPELAAELYSDVVAGQGGAGPAVRKLALERLLAVRSAAQVAPALLSQLQDPRDAAVLDALLERCRAAGEGAPKLLSLAAKALPARRASLSRDVFQLLRAQGRSAEAAEALQAVLVATEEPKARAALSVDLGELYLGLGEEKKAREAFELAADGDPESVPAWRRVVELSRGDAAAFVEAAERLEKLAGAEALAPHREALAEAYRRQGRREDALRLLSALEETPERIRLRAQLAGELARTGESLQLREKVAAGPAELAQLLFGYLEADLHKAAARVAARLDLEKLGRHARRFVAERLSSTRDGAPTACQLWPALLREEVADADGWTLYALALRQLEKVAAAELVDGFGAALTSSDAATALPKLSPVPRPAGEAFPEERDLKLVPITPLTMPRLHATLEPTVQALGARGMLLSLDGRGGVEAYLVAEGELVLGAGALAEFGPPELAYLCALALALGRGGRALREPGAVAGMDEAAAAAFASAPGSLAAARVLAQLDAEVRGGDPRAVDMAAVLRRSTAFAAVARKALELV